MPFFRFKSEKEKPKIMALLEHGRKRSQTPPCTRSSNSENVQGISENKLQPFLAFAEVTFDPSMPMQTKSRLSKTLNEVLHDTEALSYFIQFMDAKKAKHLVKFWLEAESFRISVLTRLKGTLDGEEIQRDHTSMLLRPLLSSDSSGCLSQQSDDTLHHSSQNYDSLPPSVRPKVNHQMNSHLMENSKTVMNDHSLSNDTSPCQTNIKDSEVVPSNDRNVIAQAQGPSRKTCSDPVVYKSSVESFSSSSMPTDPLEKEESVNCTSSLSCESTTSGLTRLKTSIEQDAKAIYEKYFAPNAPQPITIDNNLHNEIVGNIFRSDENADPECFTTAQKHVVKTMDMAYFSSFLRSSFHCKHQIDVLTSGNVYLADVLYNDSALFYFMEYMEQENVRHLVDFLLMADNFQKHLLSQGSSYDGVQAQSDAMIIYDKYFSLQATNSLGFSHSIRYEVEQNICREEGPLPDCYLKPVRILTQYIEKTFLLQFLSSERYFKYISECIITIQSEGANLDLLSKASGSESGSEHSLPFSSVNTLLAMADKPLSSSNKMLKNISDQVMRIDTGHFKPDSLWQRQFAGKLQLVHMDNLGRIITEFEPEPDRKKESRISKAVKKLVNRDENKVQEEMAWQVAEMIVNDICGVTMPAQYADKASSDGASS